METSNFPLPVDPKHTPAKTIDDPKEKTALV